MENRTLSELKADIPQTMKDLQAGKITMEEANNRDIEYTKELKLYNEDLDGIKQEFKKSKKAMIIDKVLKLSDSDVKLAQMIKEKLRKTAETIVEIGEHITKATDKKPKGYKDLFYETIGMSPRSAQRYMQIANHVKVQELKSQKQLDGKTMTDLLSIMSPEQSKDFKSVNTSKVANSFYARYKDNPLELDKIMKELQNLIDTANK